MLTLDCVELDERDSRVVARVSDSLSSTTARMRLDYCPGVLRNCSGKRFTRSSAECAIRSIPVEDMGSETCFRWEDEDWCTLERLFMGWELAAQG